MEEEGELVQGLVEKMASLEAAITTIQKAGSPKNNNMLIATLYRVLGLPNKKPANGVSMMTFEAGFGPTRTLLDVDFTKAPGYMIWSTDGREGREPRRIDGNVWVNKFPGQKKVLSAPYYMLVEQVAQLMRYVVVPDKIIVTLEKAKTENPTDKSSAEASIFSFTTTGKKMRGETQLGKGIKNALQSRAKGKIDMLPRHNEEASSIQAGRRGRNIQRPSSDDGEVVPMVVVGDTDKELQDKMDISTHQEMRQGGDTMVPNSNGSVPRRSEGEVIQKKRKTVIGKEKEEEHDQGDTVSVWHGSHDGIDFVFDDDEWAVILKTVHSPEVESEFYEKEEASGGNSTTIWLSDEEFDWDQN